MTLVPDLEPTVEERRASVARARLARDPSAPCVGCPLAATGAKVRPTVPVSPQVTVVCSAPSEDDERSRELLTGPEGSVLRRALSAAGVTSYSVVPLTRCRPPMGDFDSPVWVAASTRCREYLVADLVGSPPLLLLGGRPLREFAGGKVRLAAVRGLWAQADGREYFPVRDPCTLSGVLDPVARQALASEIEGDVAAMADKVLGREVYTGIQVRAFESPEAAEGFLVELARRNEPWAFDIEAYDAREFPSRKYVSTDPCHPDFRLRGVAFALSATEGAFVDCLGVEPRRVSKYLSPAFGSRAPKWAFSGHYDEEGLVYPGYVGAVVNRAGDGMLGLLALSDGHHEELRLEYAVVRILGERQYWDGYDKSRMRDAPLARVARNAVGDACYTLRLCEVLHVRLERGEYFMWGARV